MLYTEQIKMIDSNNNYNIDYEFIDEFFEKEYFKLIILLSNNKALTYWEDSHYENNLPLLEEIESSYDRLQTEEDERDLCFKNLVDSFKSLQTFDMSSPEVDGLNSRSKDCLIKYNYIIESFRNKFNEIKDELAKKVGITENS